MLNNEIKDFTFHEFKTDSDNFVKDISKLLSLGVFSKEVKNSSGQVVKRENASIEHNWHIVYPAPNFELITRDVSSFEELDGKEYSTITLDQISRITDKAVIKCKTLVADKSSLIKDSFIGENQKEFAELYLELYMPKYLCDTEIDDPLAQLDGTVPLCVNPKNGRKEATVRNYHWALLRLFDNPNEDFSGPAENKVDPVTNELVEFNSACSEWTKLSWFTDFEEKFKSELLDEMIEPSKDKVLRVPVNSSLTNKTKIRVMANIHPNRVALSVIGNPNVDYGDNRYLISSAYIGAIDSFKNSKKDIEGNFGIYTTSSTVPAIPKVSNQTTDIFSGLATDKDGEKVQEDEQWKIYESSQFPKYDLRMFDNVTQGWVSAGPILDIDLKTLNVNGAQEGEMILRIPYKKREIPRDLGKGVNGGRTTVVDKNIKVALGALSKDKKKLELNFDYEWGQDPVGSRYNNKVQVRVPASDIVSGILPVKTENITVEKPDGEYTEFIIIRIKNDDIYKYLVKYIRSEVTDTSALTPGSYTCQCMRISHNSFWCGFDEQGEVAAVVGGTERDAYGNLVNVEYHKTFGVHTANGTTDFAMYKTDSADFFQSHFLMFSSTEQFMKKHMYGKSVYTSEYFADRIKVTHSAEGVRGVLSGLITIDAESLFPFDELIVNKDFSKDKDKPEETYVYLPITAPYGPFANSPNERYGLGLLKDVHYNAYDDETKCDVALLTISEQYKDSFFGTNNVEELQLCDLSENGVTVTWTSSDENVIAINTNEGLVDGKEHTGKAK